MKLHSFLLLPLIGIGNLPVVRSYETFKLIWTAILSTDYEIASALKDQGPWAYEIWVETLTDKNLNKGALGICRGFIDNSPLLERRLKCKGDAYKGSGDYIDLVSQLNVRIQQPDDLKPDVLGFNILINWK